MADLGSYSTVSFPLDTIFEVFCFSSHVFFISFIPNRRISPRLPFMRGNCYSLALPICNPSVKKWVMEGENPIFISFTSRFTPCYHHIRPSLSVGCRVRQVEREETLVQTFRTALFLIRPSCKRAPTFSSISNKIFSSVHRSMSSPRAYLNKNKLHEHHSFFS